MSTEKLNQETTDIAKPYEPTPYERAAREAVRTRRKKTPRIKMTETKAGLELSLDHPDPAYGQALLMSAFGTGEYDFFAELLGQLGKASWQDGTANERALNFMVSVIKGVEPKDEIEALLAAQMGAVHVLTMEFACRLGSAENLLQQDSAERALNKLTRTFVAQVEALKRYRSSGEQRVVVEHVTVNEGGKVIVGNVNHGGQGASEKAGITS